MKKFFILTIISILCLTFLTACGPSAAPPDFKPYWGQLINEAAKGYLEKSVYKIEAKSLTDKDGNPLNKTEYKLDPAYSSGTYTTELTHQPRNEGDNFSIYELKNTYEFTGRYSKLGSEPIDFKDSYESEVTFKVTSLEFTTLSSKRTVENISFFELDKNFKQGDFKRISYVVTNTYKDKVVTSKLTYEKEKDNADVFKEIKNTTFTAHMGDSYFDNESLFLGIRSRKPDESFSFSYNILDPINQEVKGMQAAYVSQELDEKGKAKPVMVELANLTDKDNAVIKPSVNGTRTDEEECYKIQAKIPETNSGAPMNLYYSKTYKTKFLDKNEKTYNEAYYYFLVKVEHGDMIYTLNTFDNNARTNET